MPHAPGRHGLSWLLAFEASRMLLCVMQRCVTQSTAGCTRGFGVSAALQASLWRWCTARGSLNILLMKLPFKPSASGFAVLSLPGVQRTGMAQLLGIPFSWLFLLRDMSEWLA
jgi:hypothetical protein